MAGCLPNDCEYRFGPRAVVECRRWIDGGDSWERIMKDAMLDVETYCKRMGLKGDNLAEMKARDIVRRCKALKAVSE